MSSSRFSLRAFGLAAVCAAPAVLSSFAHAQFPNVAHANALADKDSSRTNARLRRFNLHLPHMQGTLIVKFRKNPEKNFAGESLLAQTGAGVSHTFSSNGASVLRFAEENLVERDLLEKAEELLASGEVEYVEANTILHTNKKPAFAPPNDTDFAKLWGLSNTGQTGGTAGVDINVLPAWSITTGSRNVLVGIIDTGLDATHPDIKDNVWKNPGETGLDAQGKDKATNGVDDDGNGYRDDWRGWDFANNDNDPFDDNEHGTHVAGTIGGVGDNKTGVAGVNWRVSIVPLKFLDGSGSGSLEDALKAIEYATKLGVRLTNNSWGGGAFSPTMKAVIEAANEKGILFVAAAGNEANDNDESPSYPGSYDVANVISVAAIDAKGKLASFSNYGAKKVHIGAPGVGVYSSVPGAKYDSFNGTSMAAPHVAGAAALLKAAYPNATAAQLKARLLFNGTALSSLSGKTATGARLDVARAMERDDVAPAQVKNVTVVEAGLSSLVLEWDSVGDDGMNGTAAAFEIRTGRRGVLTEEGWQRSRKETFTLTAASAPGRVRAEVSGLAIGSSGQITVRASDNVGNLGGFSASVPYAVKELRTLSMNNADSLDGATPTNTWGLEKDAGNSVFSDSPGARYTNGSDSSLTFAAQRIDGRYAVLSYRSKAQLEDTYDFGYTEISTDDGQTWTTVASVTGEENTWGNALVDLSPYLKGSVNSVQLRFRLKSDFSEVRNGWKIDDVKIQVPK